MERNRIYLIAFIVLILVAGIAVGIYFAVKEDSDDNSSSPETPFDANWVAVGSDFGGNLGWGNGNIMYSADGKEWQESTGMSFAFRGFGVAYGTSDGTSPLWVAVGNDDEARGNIMYSADGKEWQESTGMSFASWGHGVAYGTSDGTSPLWVATGSDDGDNRGWGNIMYSADGKEWQETTTGASFFGSGRGVAYGTSDGTSPLWVAVGDDDGDNRGWGNIMYSADGKEWQETTTGASFSFLGIGVAYGTSDGSSPLWVAVGYDNEARGNIMYSANGKEWQESTGMSFATSGRGVAYGTSDGTSPLWVAVGNDNEGRGNIMYSANGKEWQESTGMSFANSSYGVAYGTSDGNSPLWVAVGYDAGDNLGWGNIMYSADGKEWQESTGMSFGHRGFGVAFKSLLPNIPDFHNKY